MREFLEFAAGIFGVPAEAVSLETTYGSIPEWDSMAQLRLVMEVAAKYGVEIPFAEVTNVTSLWELWRRLNGASPKKVIAVDLDNTLWDGVVGEDGVAGIRPKVEFQRELKAMKDRGVLLVALTKNNLSDVAWFLSGDATSSSPVRKEKCPLAPSDFVSYRANWEPKAENLLSVARELNLGVESFVFVDDNPAERLEMAARLPEVTVADFPPRLAAYFPPRELTEEDRRKTEEYHAEARRRRLRQELHLESPVDLFRALEVCLDIHPLTDGEVPRVAQLSQKANQFNVCTNRYTEAEVRTMSRDGLVVTAHARDKFGDQGLVAFVIVKEGAVLDWVMSCRVMGRGIEERIEAEVERLAKSQGVDELTAMWRASGKNAPVRGLFERFGFDVVAGDDVAKSYRKAL